MYQLDFLSTMGLTRSTETVLYTDNCIRCTGIYYRYCAIKLNKILTNIFSLLLIFTVYVKITFTYITDYNKHHLRVKRALQLALCTCSGLTVRKGFMSYIKYLPGPPLVRQGFEVQKLWPTVSASKSLYGLEITMQYSIQHCFWCFTVSNCYSVFIQCDM